MTQWLMHPLVAAAPATATAVAAASPHARMDQELAGHWMGTVALVMGQSPPAYFQSLVPQLLPMQQVLVPLAHHQATPDVGPFDAGALMALQCLPWQLFSYHQAPEPPRRAP